MPSRVQPRAARASAVMPGAVNSDSVPPCSQRSFCIWPNMPRGVWHSAQWPMTLPRYCPRSQAGLWPCEPTGSGALDRNSVFQPNISTRRLKGKGRAGLVLGWATGRMFIR